jgi:multimeric flavodoxin WrbA
MKVIAFNGSARKNGNTSILISHVFEELRNEDIETGLISLSGLKIRGCTACGKCFENMNKQCILDDEINTFIREMLSADGIILASPTYFADVSTELKALIDRCGMVAIANRSMFARKIGAAIIAVRRGGAIHAFDTINHFFLINQMIIPGSSYWNVGIGMDKGDVSEDEEGIRTMSNLGKNMAWLMKKIYKS